MKMFRFAFSLTHDQEKFFQMMDAFKKNVIK